MKTDKGEVVDKKDEDFYKFKSEGQIIHDTYYKEHPEDRELFSYELEGLLSNLMIKNTSVYISPHGNIHTKFCGLKTEVSYSRLNIYLHGIYEGSHTVVVVNVENDYPTFYKWYVKQVEICKEKIKQIQSSIDYTTGLLNIERLQKKIGVVGDKSSNEVNVVFSVGGNDYSFEGLNGMKFIFKETEDNGVRFDVKVKQ